MIVAKEYAAESGHWYTRDGVPRYTIIGANGRERNTPCGMLARKTLSRR